MPVRGGNMVWKAHLLIDPGLDAGRMGPLQGAIAAAGRHQVTAGSILQAHSACWGTGLWAIGRSATWHIALHDTESASISAQPDRSNMGVHLPSHGVSSSNNVSMRHLQA